MADDLYGGYAPKQGCFGCLPKVLHDAKPAKQATLDTPFLSTIGFIDSLMPAGVLRAGLIFVYCALFPSDDLSELVSSFLLSVLPVLSVPSGTSGFSTEAMSFI